MKTVQFEEGITTFVAQIVLPGHVDVCIDCPTKVVHIANVTAKIMDDRRQTYAFLANKTGDLYQILRQNAKVTVGVKGGKIESMILETAGAATPTMKIDFSNGLEITNIVVQETIPQKIVGAVAALLH